MKDLSREARAILDAARGMDDPPARRRLQICRRLLARGFNLRVLDRFVVRVDVHRPRASTTHAK